MPVPAPGLLRRRGEEVPPSIHDRYLRLPILPARVSTLAEALTSGHVSAYEKAVAINQYLLRHYAYNLQAPRLPERADAVDYLLFESKQGACEAFASAMTVLLRAAGVPARLVTGYTTGTYNLFTGYYEVRNSDAHAWVEVFIPGAGWIEFEPTPGFPAPEEAAAHSGGRWLARDGALWTAAALRRVADRLLELLAWPVPAGALAGIVTALLLSLVLVRRYTGAIRAGDAVRTAYIEMLRALRRHGIVRGPDQTPREFLLHVPEAARAPAGEVTALFERAAYGGAAVTADDERRVREAVMRTARALRRRRS